jgi:hypothetical protein
MGAKPRPRPCASCPYRKNVPSGVWDESEYVKLPEYDKEMGEQPAAPFGCHQGDGSICSGWLGYHDPLDMLAVRLGLMRGILDESCATYQTTVPLFTSGAEAAAHGMKDIDAPSTAAEKTIQKLTIKKSTERNRP